MDITNDQEKSSNPSQSPSSSPPFDHVIPEMIITSPDDTLEEQQNTTEIPSSIISSSNKKYDMSIEDTSVEFTVANSMSEEKPVVDFEDISGIVKDVISKCTESVSHSVRQRPLVMEVDKNAQQQESKDSSIKCPPPPPPPIPPSITPPPPPPSVVSPPVSSSVITSPTAMQRPLIFEGSVSRTDNVPEMHVENLQSFESNQELVCDRAYQGMQSTSETPAESAKTSDESTTPTKKESLHSVKKFFGSMLHHETQEPVVSSEEAPSPKDSVSPDVSKSEKSVIKKFFPSNKTEVTKLEPSPSPEIPSEIRESTSFAKEAKQNIKSFFDTFKHGPVESKDSLDGKADVALGQKEIESEKNVQSSVPESPKESTSFAKDTKQNIKAFFDTFKHEHNEQKQSDKKSVSPVDLSSEPKFYVSPSTPESPKESTSFVKDTKQNIKAFFDTFKPEPSEAKSKSGIAKKSASQPDISSEMSPEQNLKSFEAESLKEKKESSFVKDTKQNIKSFFDTFKPESSTPKHKDTCKKSASHPDFRKESGDFDVALDESIETPKHKESTSFTKGAKQNVKQFFDSFKSESSSKQEEKHKKVDFTVPSGKKLGDEADQKEVSNESAHSSKDAKQSIKTFFDNFKLGDINADVKNKETSSKKQTFDEADLHIPATDKRVTTPKDTKQNVKTFFSNFKLGDLNADHSKETVKKPFASEPDLNKEPTEGVASLSKESKQPAKKFFSFKQTGESNLPEISDSQIPKKMTQEKPTKVVKSVKLDLRPTYSNGSENLSASSNVVNGHELEITNEIRERAQSVPADLSKNEKFFVSSDMKNSDVSAGSVDSPTVQVTDHKGSRQSFKKFFDSFKHEKSDAEKCDVTKKESTKDLNVPDILAEDGKAKPSEKTPKEKKSKSIRRSLSDKMNREEVVQNFKGFFDSLGHKSTSKKSSKESEHIYDVVEVKPEMDNTLLTSSESNQAVKDENQGKKKNFNPFSSREVSKSGSENIYITENKLNVKKGETSPKESEFQISLDLPKEATPAITAAEGGASSQCEPGMPKPDKSVFNAIGENILALKDKMLHTKEKRKSEIIEDSEKISDLPSKMDELEKEKPQKALSPHVSDEKAKEKQIKADQKLSKKASQVKDGSERHLASVSPVPGRNETAANPSSLYDTCCIKIAVLLRDKAVHIVTDHSKSPPPKPPKPSAEAIAKARAAAVSRRIQAQKLNQSIGESFPVGCDSMRFADDDTESSCDYHDVENLDYIIDYELINRYKIDSNKLDTFSVPSTCSGLTSYYTADTITLRDENFSDGMMETISLSSDVPYNFKQLSTTSKSEESKINKEASTSKDLSDSRQSTVLKRVPPPIPPKPLILQNISKLKGNADDKSISQCVNGLSLSPRLQNKYSKDPAATQKRPLMVADIKGTQFSSLQHPKKPQKPARNFNTVLRNESLKKISPVPSNGIGPIEKVSVDSVSVQKRTVSPPRPPPPNILKKPEKPPKPERPPLPNKPFKSPVSDEMPLKIQKENENMDMNNELNDMINPPEENQCDLMAENEAEALKDKSHETSAPESIVDADKSQFTEISLEDSCLPDRKTQEDNLNNNEAIKDIADSLNNNLEVSSSELTETPKPPPRSRRVRSRTVEVMPTEKQEEGLKRSHSLSDIDVEKRVTFLEAEKAKIDSKSLYTTINKNGKKIGHEKTSQSSPDLVSGRPLPAPPPPPRRFRSLERKSKKLTNERSSDQNVNISEQITTADNFATVKPPIRRRKTDKQRFFSLHTDQRKDIETASEILKRAESVPSKPNRRVKSPPCAKYDVNANISSFDSHLDSSELNIPYSDSSVTDSIGRTNPKNKNKSDSRKLSNSSWYDENESFRDSWEMVDIDPSQLPVDECEESPEVPLRRKAGIKRKSRETSTFYVSMMEESNLPFDEGCSSSQQMEKEPPPPSSAYVDKGSSHLPLVDKETSPLPLDCSEKSVQTSLETLSQGIVSRDEQSEDTDELLDLAQTLQKELSVIINRHKSVNEDTEDTPSPPLSTAASEKNLAEDFKEIKKTSSLRSSTSEVWPVTSSDESDVERAGEDSSNISEVSVKRKQKKIFYIAREIMTSEEAFVDALKLLNVDFKAAVEAANKQKNMNVIPEEVLAQILNHLPQLQHLNENLLMELKDRIENWDKHEKIADIIVKMGPFLKLYSWYIHDFESNVSLLEECKKKYPAFCQTVKDFEMSARCKRLALNHYMLKPIQRIPQYRLLLQEYLHHLIEDSKDYQDTVTALQIVSEVANHANDSMKQGDNAQKLISIQNSIMGHKEIVKPGRVFVKEGELMKLSRKGMQPRWFVLFNDLLLYLTPVQQGLYRINHELPLTGMKVAIPIQQDYQNEFSIISVTRSFTLAARSQEERQEWIIALTKAIEENASKRRTFICDQDRTSSENEGAFVLGKKAPVWIPDARVTMCQLCTSEFTVTFRRHHCRACGKVICSVCSSHRISLPYLGNRIARVCDECHTRLGQGSSGCTESGETDSDNQQIAVKSHLRTDNRHVKKNKRMLPSVLKEVCANDQGSTISGYLHKKTGKSWKRDWFVVKDKVLYEYKASEDVAALRSIPLLGYQIESFSEVFEGVDASVLFQLTHPGQAPVIFYADTVGSAERWISALKAATVLE